MGSSKNTSHELKESPLLTRPLKKSTKSNRYLSHIYIRTVANKNLSELSKDTGQTAHLVILNGKEGVYLDKVEGEKAAIRYSRLGGRVPLHCSAVGKILAAFQTHERMHDLLLEYTFAPRTSNTILEKNDFIRELEVVRKRGYAVDNQENEPGVRCVAAPVFDHSGQVAAAISLSTMTSSVDDEELNNYIEKLLKEATAISLLLGFREIS